MIRALACAAALSVPAVPAVLCPGTAWAAPAASPAEVQRATHLYMKGSELFKANRFQQALDDFKASYATVASPNSHLYIARCLAALGQARNAWIEYDRTASEASIAGAKYAQTGATAAQERDDLGGRLLAVVSVVVQGADPSSAVRIGPYDVPSDRIGQPFPLDPGTFDVVLRAAGRSPTVKSVTFRAGERRDLIVTPFVSTAPTGPVAVAPSESSSGGRLGGLRIGAIVATAVGVAGFVMFAVEGSASKSTLSTIQSECGGVAGCPSQTGAGRANVNSQISTGKSQQTIANVGVGIGAVGLAAGVTMFALSFRRPPSDSAPRATLDLGPTWVGAHGSF